MELSLARISILPVLQALRTMNNQAIELAGQSPGMFWPKQIQIKNYLRLYGHTSGI